MTKNTFHWTADNILLKYRVGLSCQPINVLLLHLLPYIPDICHKVSTFSPVHSVATGVATGKIAVKTTPKTGP